GEKEKMAHTYIYSRLTLNQEPFKNTSKLNQNWLLFSDWTESKESLNLLMAQWFKNEQLHPVYDFYLDTINWGKDGAISNVNFNNRYLNLMQGLEAYYDYLNPNYKYENETFVAERQRVYDALESAELKRWVGMHLKFPKQANFAQKLKFLCDKYTEILTNLEAKSSLIERYPYKAKEYRHKLSHGKINKTFQGKDLNSLYAFSQVLLCISILDSIGMSHRSIANRINTNPDINRHIPR
uniref:HEPN domain-containing protein n=1 Tax=Nonlabens dokdonensis TaxID=328515 RepID=UPI0026ED1550